jgi:putative RNA 2'-phosphotransferase
MKNNSKLLSLVLRHKPETIGLELDKNGWVTIGRLLDQMEVHDRMMDYEELMDIVENNDKKRFEIKKADFGDNGYDDLIRATQGHSVKVDLGLKAERPPMKLYHGTVDKTIDPIMKDGLKKMNRHAVHLSEDVSTATKVGGRRGKPIILEVNSGHMYTDKIKFFKSNNGVWLTNSVDPKYIKLKEL